MIVEYFFPPHQRIEKECRSLCAAGHDVRVLCYRQSQQPALETVSGLAEVHRCWFPSSIRPFRLLYGGRWWYNRYWLNPIRRFADAVQPEALHVHDLPLAAAAHTVARERNIPLVLDFHENWPAFMNWAKAGYNGLIQALVDVRGWRRYESCAAAWADRLIVVDASNQDFLEATYNVPREKIVVVSNTPELDRLMPNLAVAKQVQRSPDAPLRILYMGHIDQGRGIHTVIEALPQCGDALRSAVLTIVGKGPHVPRLEALAARLGVAQRVQFEGFQPYDALAGYLADCDIGVVPHLRDEYTDNTIPNKIFEYMAAGLPVLASDCVPLRRVIEGADCGQCFTSGDVESCREVLCRMAQSSSQRKAWGENGKRAALETYNWRVTAQSLLQMYGELAESKHQHAHGRRDACESPLSLPARC
jgi:glycosyltransferase involved in cell wall biosynthesis